MKSNFEQEAVFIVLSNAKSLETLTCKVLWAALGIALGIKLLKKKPIQVLAYLKRVLMKK